MRFFLSKKGGLRIRGGSIFEKGGPTLIKGGLKTLDATMVQVQIQLKICFSASILISSCRIFLILHSMILFNLEIWPYKGFNNDHGVAYGGGRGRGWVFFTYELFCSLIFMHVQTNFGKIQKYLGTFGHLIYNFTNFQVRKRQTFALQKND